MRIHIQNGADDPMAVTEDELAAAAARAGVTGLQPSFADTGDGFREGLRAAEVLIGAPGVLAKLLPAPAPELKLVFSMASGVDRLAPFDWLPATAVLLNNRGVHGGKVGEFGAMALLMLAHGMPRYAAQQAKREWRPHFTPTMRDRRLTVVGAGDLGAAIARAARGFGMIVTGVRTSAVPHPDFHEVLGIDAIDAVLRASEFLALACPLTPATRGLLDRRRIALLPAGAKIVNVGRGPLLDEDALADALDAGALGGAVLDVFHQEPLPSDSRLWTTPNLVVTPHVAADDPSRYNSDSLDIFFANLLAGRNGEAMPNRVDTGRGY